MLRFRWSRVQTPAFRHGGEWFFWRTGRDLFVGASRFRRGEQEITSRRLVAPEPEIRASDNVLGITMLYSTWVNKISSSSASLSQAFRAFDPKDKRLCANSTSRLFPSRNKTSSSRGYSRETRYFLNDSTEKNLIPTFTQTRIVESSFD